MEIFVVEIKAESPSVFEATAPISLRSIRKEGSLLAKCKHRNKLVGEPVGDREKMNRTMVG